MNRWAKQGVLDAVFAELQRQHIIQVRVESVSLDRTIIPVHPDGTGAVKNGPQCVGRSRGAWTTTLDLVAADAASAVNFTLTPGQAGDGPAGRSLLQSAPPEADHVVMDRAYEGDDTRQLVLELDMEPVVPPKQHRRRPWRYSQLLYCTRNEVERLFRRLKGYRRIFARFDKLDVVFPFFVHPALIIEGLGVNRP